MNHNPKLILRHRGVVLRSFTVEKDLISVGRRTGADIQLDDPTVSGAHATIRVRRSPYLNELMEVFVEDNGSTNGTFLNGDRITEQRLRHGDTIRIGQHELVFESEDDTGLDRTAVMITPN